VSAKTECWNDMCLFRKFSTVLTNNLFYCSPAQRAIKPLYDLIADLVTCSALCLQPKIGDSKQRVFW